MKLPPFEYLEPSSLARALSILDQHRENVRVIAGGTDLINRMKLRLITPRYLMGISRLKGLGRISERDGNVVIGAAVSIRELHESPLLKEKYRAVAEAASLVAAPPLVTMGTVGGNILQETRCKFYNQSGIVLTGLDACHKRGGRTCLAVNGGKRCFSVYQGDLAPALIAFDARCVLEKSGDRRTIPLRELFTGQGATPFSIESNELLTEILLPKQNDSHGSAYRKLRLRGSLDYPLVSAAAVVSAGTDGSLGDCRLVIGAAGPMPVVVEEAAGVLKGKIPDAELISKAAEPAFALSRCVDNLALPGEYRIKMARTFSRRAIGEALADMKKRI